MKPIHKFNNGRGATICTKCSVIISTGLTEDLYCEKCKPKQESLVERMIPLQLKYNLYMMKQETLEEVKQECRITKIMQMDAKMAYDSLPKQETTLEKAAEKFTPKSDKWTIKEIFIEGAKWQQERNYSEEDMMDYSNYRLLIKKALDPKEWFEQFKKK